MSLHLEVILFLLLSSFYLHKVNHHTVVLIEEFIDESSPVDEACETFSSTFMDFCNAFIPSRNVLIRENDKT